MQLQEVHIENRAESLRREMAGWYDKPRPTDSELRPYGLDIYVRAKVLLDTYSTKHRTGVPANLRVENQPKTTECDAKISRPYMTLDTRTTGSVRSVQVVEKLPNGNSYPVPDGTIQIVEFFTPNLHVGTNEEQSKNIVSAVKNATTPETILEKGDVVFTIYPKGDVRGWSGVINIPEEITLASLALLEIEEMEAENQKRQSPLILPGSAK